MTKRQRAAVVIVAAAAWIILGLWLSGTLNELVGGPSPRMSRARSNAEKLPQVLSIKELGLRARVTADARCSDFQGTSCQTPKHFIYWSVCPVSEPGDYWARTPRTWTCDSDDKEVGDRWNQERVAKTTIAGFDGFIVSWSPIGRANRGDGCSFRGYRKDERQGWVVLQIEGHGGCDEDMLAMMVSAEATGPLPPITNKRPK